MFYEYIVFFHLIAGMFIGRLVKPEKIVLYWLLLYHVFYLQVWANNYKEGWKLQETKFAT